jgi:hypothetical protein
MVHLPNFLGTRAAWRILPATAVLTAIVLSPSPGHAWVRVGVGLALPPVVVAPPAYIVPPPVYYYPPPPVASAPAGVPAAPPGQTCYASSYVCPASPPGPVGSPCSCPAQNGGRVAGSIG